MILHVDCMENDNFDRAGCNFWAVKAVVMNASSRQSQPMTNDQSVMNIEHYLDAVGNSVRALRKKRGLSQEALADKAGLDRAHLGRIERGTRNVSLLNLVRIANGLSVPPSLILRSVESWGDTNAFASLIEA